jgi:hypothetical protein
VPVPDDTSLLLRKSGRIAEEGRGFNLALSFLTVSPSEILSPDR